MGAPARSDRLRTERTAVGDALAALGVDRLVFGIHATAFPAGAMDVGYGSPHSKAGRRLLAFAEGLGFNALQLGPGGQISNHDVSPYDGAAFARNILCLDLEALCEERFGALLARDELESLALAEAGNPTRSEPARSLGERRLKRSPLRDVAGMLRSFDYAAQGSLIDLTREGSLRAEDLPRLAPWARLWRQWMGSVFLRSCLRTVEGSELVPRDPAQLAGLLDALMLEKAVYELGYELNNRPDWAIIPLRSILELLGEHPKVVV